MKNKKQPRRCKTSARYADSSSAPLNIPDMPDELLVEFLLLAEEWGLPSSSAFRNLVSWAVHQKFLFPEPPPET